MVVLERIFFPCILKNNTSTSFPVLTELIHFKRTFNLTLLVDMRKIKLYIAISMNGKIARSDGSVDWLEAIPKPDDSDYGYNEFYDSVGATIQGNNTYKKVLSW